MIRSTVATLVVAGLAEATTTGCTLALRTAIALVGGELGSQVTFAIHFTTAYPYLYTYDTNLGVSLYESVVDVGAEGVEGCTAFLEHLAAGHFGSVETAADLNLDAFGTGTHGACHGHLDCTAVSNLAFDLARDVGSHNLGVKLGAFTS